MSHYYKPLTIKRKIQSLFLRKTTDCTYDQPGAITIDLSPYGTPTSSRLDTGCMTSPSQTYSECEQQVNLRVATRYLPPPD